MKIFRLRISLLMFQVEPLQPSLPEIQENLFKTCMLICDVSNSTHLEMSMTKNIRLHPKYLYLPTYFKLYLRLHSFLRKQFVILLKGISSLQRKYLIAGIRLHMYFTKGQIISDQICGVLKFSKKAMKYCQDFCPCLDLKWVK